jgi:hypothetical protein
VNQPLSAEAIAGYAYRAGFRGQGLTTAVAVALAESGGRPRAVGDVGLEDRTWGPSVGLWQIRSLRADHDTGRQRDARANLDPEVNARHAYQISDGGRKWQPWSTYTNGSYRTYLRRARVAAQKAAQRTAAQPGGRPPVGPSRHGGPERIVLDLNELRRLDTLLTTSRDRIEHSARVVHEVHGLVQLSDRSGGDPDTADQVSALLASADGPAGLQAVARHLDFDAQLVARTCRLAQAADGPDGRYSQADLVPFLRTVGNRIDLPEAAVLEALAAGRVRASHRTAAHAPSRTPRRPEPPKPKAEKRGDIVPAALRRYHNGKLPDSVLASIGAGARLYAPAARHFARMRAAARLAGVTLTADSGYRSVAEQARLYRLYQHGEGNLAAPPGTSNHGWGLSADINVAADTKSGRWLRANAARYGFFNDVPSEPWHWTYRPA